MIMHKSQKRGVIFFSSLALLSIGFQCYGLIVKGDLIDFKKILVALALIVFCYTYPIKIKNE
jgi:thiamine transporter ThiT